MKKILPILISVYFSFCSLLFAQEEIQEQQKEVKERKEYIVGLGDKIAIYVYQPEKINMTVTVAPDGYIGFPYIGSFYAKGLTLKDIQQIIEKKLATGYMKYPVVAVFLEYSMSRKFYVYGEVSRPGTYPLEENATVLKAISMAGGFSKFGSSSRVKVLREFKDKPGYKQIKVSIDNIMHGKAEEDIVLEPGDIVVVSEGMF